MRNLPLSTNVLTRLTVWKLLLRLRTFNLDITPKAILCYHIIVNSLKSCQLYSTARYHVGDCHLHRPDMSWDRCGRGTVTTD